MSPRSPVRRSRLNTPSSGPVLCRGCWWCWWVWGCFAIVCVRIERVGLIHERCTLMMITRMGMGMGTSTRIPMNMSTRTRTRTSCAPAPARASAPCCDSASCSAVALASTRRGSQRSELRGHESCARRGESYARSAGPGAKVSRRQLVSMGFAGGLVPSPSALVVLLGAIALERLWFGVILVVA